MSKLKLLLPFYIFITSCGALSDAGKVLRNEKVQTTDEFLVEKRNPLVIPPNFEEIPEPGSIGTCICLYFLLCWKYGKSFFSVLLSWKYWKSTSPLLRRSWKY